MKSPISSMINNTPGNISELQKLPRQRILITIENGQITNAKPVPNESYIAHAGNIEAIAAHVAQKKALSKEN